MFQNFVSSSLLRKKRVVQDHDLCHGYFYNGFYEYNDISEWIAYAIVTEASKSPVSLTVILTVVFGEKINNSSYSIIFAGKYSGYGSINIIKMIMFILLNRVGPKYVRDVKCMPHK